MDCPTSSHIKVAVRVRPLNPKERSRNAQSVVEALHGTQVALYRPFGFSARDDIGLKRELSAEDLTRRFTFDRAFQAPASSMAEVELAAAERQQREIYHDLGRELLNHAFEGYNSALLAYGQTSSGKSYTMFGPEGIQQAQGLIPRLCQELFERIEALHVSDPATQCHVEVSYMEI